MGQKAGARRFMMRVTDSQGQVLPVEARPIPWGPVLDPAEGELPEEIVDLWRPLYSATEVEPPEGQALRDLADYAQRSHLPGRDQTMIQVALEGAFDVSASPRTLQAWMGLLDETRRTSLRARHGVPDGTEPGDSFAQLRLRLGSAWAHYYGRRLSLAWSEVAAIRRDSPNFLPAQRLQSILYEDLGWTQTAVETMRITTRLYPRRQGPRR